MRALTLATGLHSKRKQLADHGIRVANAADLEDLSGPIDLYHIQSIELDELAKEINLFVEYFDDPDPPADVMTAEQFLDRLMPLASDNPDFNVEVSIRFPVTLAGESFERYDMPIRSVTGFKNPPMVVLGVDGLHDLPRD